MSKRAGGEYVSRKKARTTTIIGYDRKKGGLQPGARALVKQVAAAAARRAGEKKGMDTLVSQDSVIATTSTNASAFALNLVGAGTGYFQRIGRRINLQSLRLRIHGQHIYASTSGDAALRGNTLRVVLVWDKQPSGAALPTFADIFGHTTQGGTEQAGFMDPIRYDMMERFSVLRDCIITLNPGATPSDPTTATRVINEFTLDEFVKLGNRETIFRSETGNPSIVDISTGSLLLYYRAKENSSLNFFDIDQFTSFARLRYTDM